MTDGGLRQVFRDHLPKIDWQAIESAMTGSGIPDFNGCINGMEFWIENKWTETSRVTFEPAQVGWIERRIRHGGRVFIAVRYKHAGGPRKGRKADSLYLFHGGSARALAENGLIGTTRVGSWYDGPARWDWDEINWHLIT